MRSPFLGSMYRSRSLNLDQQSCINLYLELAENKQGKQKGMLLMTPGLDPLVITPTPGLLWAVYAAGIVAFDLNGNFTGNVYPVIDFEGPNTYLTEPVSLLSGASSTIAVRVDANGGVYAFNFYTDDTPSPTVTYYPATPDRNTAPTRILGGAATTMGNSGNGGMAIDGTGRIWTAISNGTATGTIYIFAAGAQGNTAPIQTITRAIPGNGEITSLRYDPYRNWVWVVSEFGGTPANAAAAIVNAYDMNGTQQRSITGAATTFVTPKDVQVDSAGLIYVADTGVTADLDVPSVFVFAANANGNVAPTQTITGAATKMVGPVGIEVSRGVIYVFDGLAGAALNVGGLNGASYNSAILAYPVTGNGNIPPTANVQGANTHINIMDDGTTAGVALTLFIGPAQTLSSHYHPPATRFVAGSQAVSGNLTLPASSRYGLLSFWTFGAPETASEFWLGDIGGRGLTVTTDNSIRVKPVLTLYDASGAVILVVKPDGYPPNIPDFCHLWFNHLISWDTQTQTIQWYVNGADSGVSAAVWSSSNPVSYPAEHWRVGHSTYGVDLGLSELYFETPASLYDLTTSANVAKFVTGSETMSFITYGFPVSLGSTGQLPTGSTPKIFLHGAGTGFATNQGTAGDFTTVTGTLIDAKNNP